MTSLQEGSYMSNKKTKKRAASLKVTISKDSNKAGNAKSGNPGASRPKLVIGICAAVAIIAIAAILIFQAVTAPKIAATVNGTDVLYEDEVTEYIQDMRVAMDLTDDGDWAQYLVNHDYTPGYLRSQAITYLTNKIAVRQRAAEEGLPEITSEMITDAKAQVMIEQGIADDADWDAYMAELGYTDDNYEEFLEELIIDDFLLEVAESESDEVTEYAILKKVEEYREGLDGNQLVRIYSSDDESALHTVSDLIANGDDEKVEQMVEAGDAALDYEGYTAFATYDQAVANALDGLVSGDVTEVVVGEQSPDTYFLAIVDDVLIFPADGFDSVDQMPTELLEVISEVVGIANSQEKIAEIKKEIEDKAVVEISDMPEGLPYDVSLAGYERQDYEDVGSADMGPSLGDIAQVEVDEHGNVISGFENIFDLSNIEGEGEASIEYQTEDGTKLISSNDYKQSDSEEEQAGTE